MADLNKKLESVKQVFLTLIGSLYSSSCDYSCKENGFSFISNVCQISFEIKDSNAIFTFTLFETKCVEQIKEMIKEIHLVLKEEPLRFILAAESSNIYGRINKGDWNFNNNRTVITWKNFS